MNINLTMMIVIVLAVFVLMVMTEIKWGRKRKEYAKPFDPRVIPNMEPLRPGKIVRCTESHSGFTAGKDYKVRIAYADVPIVYNDEFKMVVAAGLNPEKFEVTN